MSLESSKTSSSIGHKQSNKESQNQTAQSASTSPVQGDSAQAQATSSGTRQFITQHGSQYTLNVAPDGMHFGREANDLVVTDASGNSETLANFFVTSGKELPDMVLADGTVIAAHDFLQAQNPDMDLATAAGGSLTSNSGGLGSYGDDSGSLVGGFDRLGSLGTSQWSRTGSALGGSSAGTRASALDTDDTDNELGGGSTGGGSGGGSTGGGSGGGEVTPTPPSPINYEARAVLYKTDDNASETVGFRLLGADGKPLPVQNPADVDLTDRNGFFDLANAVLNPDGTVSLTLTQAGRDALLASGGANLYDYITVTVDGREYTMQVVVNQDGNFTSAAEDALLHGGSNQSGYEWHNEQDGSATGDRNANAGTTDTPGNNEAWFTNSTGNAGEAAFSGSFVAHAGNDTVSITSAGVGMGKGNSTQSGSLIDLGGGTDSLTITSDKEGMKAEAGFDNTVRNVEEVTITSQSDGMSAADGGANRIENAGNVTISSDNGSGMKADAPHSSNTISDVSGNVTLDSKVVLKEYPQIPAGDASGDEWNSFWQAWTEVSNYNQQATQVGTVNASNSASNTITAIAGNVTLTGEGNALSAANGTNLISHIANEVSLHSMGTNMNAHSGGSNTITEVGGNVTLHSDASFGMNATGSYSTTSSNTISNVQNNVTISGLNDAMYAEETGGANIIKSVAGDLTLASIQGSAIHSFVGGSNTISHIGGNIALTGGIVAEKTGSSNTVEHVGGNMSITTNSNALYAGTFSSNTISDVQQDLTIISQNGNAIHANSSGSNRIEKVGGSLVLNSKDDALSSSYSSSNTINKVDHDVAITSSNGKGLYTISDSSNTITNVGGNVTLNSMGNGMYADASYATFATNTISNVTKDVTITSNGAGYDLYGLSAKAGGSNTIDTVGGNVTLTSQNGGLYAEGIGSTNAISNVMNDVTITSLDYRLHVYAENGGANIIDTVGGNVIVGTSSTSSPAGLEAYGGSNTINNVKGDVILTGNYAIWAYDFNGHASSTTINNIGRDVVLNATDGYGVQIGGKGTTCTISNVGRDVVINAAGVGFYSGSSAQNIIDTVKGSVTINSTGQAMVTSGHITLDGSDFGNTIRNVTHDVTVNGISTGSALAVSMYAYCAGTNLIDTVGGNVTLNSYEAGNYGYGMYAYDSPSFNIISNVTHNVTLNSSGLGMSTAYGGSNTIDTVGGNVIVNSNRATMSTYVGSNTISNVKGDVTLNGGGVSCELGSNSIHTVGGHVTVSSKDIGLSTKLVNPTWGASNFSGMNTITEVGSVSVTSKGDAMNAMVKASGSNFTDNGALANTISHVTQNVALTSSEGMGLSASLVSIYTGSSNSGNSNSSSSNTITEVGGSVSVMSNGDAMNAFIDSSYQGSVDNGVATNTISHIKGDVELTSTNGMGLSARLDVHSALHSSITNSNSTNTITQVGGNVSVNSKGDAMSAIMGSIDFGILYNDAATNTISHVKGDVTLTSTEGKGLYADAHSEINSSIANSNSSNTISNIGGNVTVNSKGDAMYAAGAGSSNTISNVGGVITLNGRVYANSGGSNSIDQRGSEHSLQLIIKVASGNALSAGNNGKNLIYGSDHDDVVRITGGITGTGTNLIDTGKGNDIIHLDGSVQNLTLQAGEGYDILVLHCDSLTDLSANYQSWLTNLMTQNHGVESIQIEGLNTIGDLPSWLTNLANSHGVDVSLHGGDVDTAHAASTDYAADTSYVVDLHGNALHDNVTLNSGHDKVDVHDGLNTHLDTGAGNDFVTVHGGVISPSAGIDLGSGNDHLVLSGAISVTGADALKGGSGYDVLHIGDMTHLNGHEANGGHLNLSDLAGVLDGFEVVDMTGGSGTHLTIDAATVLSQFGIDSGSHGNFTGSAAANFNDHNTLVIKGDGSDTVSVDTGHWTAQSTVTDQNHTVFDVYSHGTGSDQEFILIQQQIITQS